MSLTLHLKHYEKRAHVKEDCDNFFALTKVKVLNWADNGHEGDTLELYMKPGELEYVLMSKVIERLSTKKEFKGWICYPEAAVKNLYYTPCSEVELTKVEFTSFTTPFDIIPHYTASMSNASTRLVANFEHDIQRLQVYICDNSTQWSRISLQYADLGNQVVQQICSDGTVRLVLPLNCATTLWNCESVAVEKKRQKLKKDYKGEALEQRIRLKADWKRVKTLHDDTENCIAECSALTLTYKARNQDVSRIVSGFMRHNIDCVFTRFNDVPDQASSFDKNWIEKVVASHENTKDDHVNLRYALKCLESVGFQFLDKLHEKAPPHAISFYDLLMNDISKGSPEQIRKITETLYKICQEFDRKPFLNLVETYKKLILKVDPVDLDEYSHYQYIKRIIVTPSRIIFVPPEPIATNRIIRENFAYLDSFARVSFRDEDFSQFNSQSNSATDGVRNVIYEGVKLSENIVFKFLGCSNSQLRSQGLWLFYEVLHKNIESIRDKIGNLKEMKTVQKYVTRMGLAFTATDFTLNMEVKIREEPDVIAKEGNIIHTFSDGCGTISPYIQRQIVTQKYGKDAKYWPVAFQIRAGGCKGMVSINPDLYHSEVVIRKSMRKFDSENPKLEPCGYSGINELYMNRQVIAILSARGVPDESFIALQNKSLIEIAQMLVDEQYAKLEMSNKLRVRQSDLKSSCFKITTEPYLRNQLISLYKFKLTDAMVKTRFRIDHHFGRQMKGIMDETGTLNYGQIFVQYTELNSTSPSFQNRKIHTGTTFVTKNPCLHPGDLQVLEAVDKPELRHLYDVIVFPCRGPRPHPNEMSGSDLDGDEYFVCWEPSLLPPEAFEAADYYLEHDGPPKEKDEIDLDKINKFVFEYITKGSKLGQISNAHAIWADREAEGVKSPKCIDLAKKHSDAVDFIKTGIPAEFDYADRSRIYPDWMMKPDKVSYESTKAIGRMFHIVQGLEQAVLHRTSKETEVKVAPLINLREQLDETEIQEAEKQYQSYCNKLANIMTSYGIKDEGDIAAGCLNTIKKSLAKEHERNYDMREQVLSMFRRLQRTYKNIFYKQINQLKATAGQDVIQQSKIRHAATRKAAAWYYVTYNNPQLHQGLLLLSFPWCVPEELLKIPYAMQIRVDTEHNSINSMLLAEFQTWFSDRWDQSEHLRDIGKQIRDILRIKNFSGEIRDLSSYVYGHAPTNRYIFHLDKSNPEDFLSSIKRSIRPIRFGNLQKEAKEKLSKLISNVQKVNQRYYVCEMEYTDDQIQVPLQVVLTDDKKLLKKTNILVHYVQRYDNVAPALFAAVNWAVKSNIVNVWQEIDIALSFIGFVLSEKREAFKLIDVSDDFPEISEGEPSPPDVDTMWLYLDYLKWIVLGGYQEVALGDADDIFLKEARKLLSAERTHIAAMQEFHSICYSLKFTEPDDYHHHRKLWKSEKKTCFNIARATSFCTRFFGKKRNEDLNRADCIDVKIRETELGGVSSLVLEVFGENPQKMNSVAAALHIDEEKFYMFHGFLKIKGEKFKQKALITNNQLKSDSYTWKMYDPERVKHLSINVPVIRYNRDFRHFTRDTVIGNIKLMKEKYFNPISHGTVALSATFGKLSTKILENGVFRNGCIVFQENMEASILSRIRSLTTRVKHAEVTTIFEVIFEELSYRIVFTRDEDPVSISLREVNWSQIMVQHANNNPMDTDIDIGITSTHTLDKNDMKHLPLTADLISGKSWIGEKTHEAITVADDLPCYVSRIEVWVEDCYAFTKDPELKNITLSCIKKEVFEGEDQGTRRVSNVLKRSKQYREVVAKTTLEDINNTELVGNFLEVVLNMAVKRLNTRSRCRTPSGGNRKHSGSGGSSSNDKAPTKPLKPHNLGHPTVEDHQLALQVGRDGAPGAASDLFGNPGRHPREDGQWASLSSSEASPSTWSREVTEVEEGFKNNETTPNTVEPSNATE